MKTNVFLAFAAVCISISSVAPAALAGPGHGTLAFGEPGHASDVDRTIELSMDGMSYGIDALQVSAGETIRFIIHNDSQIEHDFTIGDHATQEAHQAEMMDMMASGSGMMEHDDANAAFLAPGETKELIWTFSEAGAFEFACNVPGHYQSGMHGPITVSAL